MSKEGNGSVRSCSFCGKAFHSVRRLIAAPPPNDNVCVCDECVRLCNSLIQAERTQEVQREPWAPEPLVPQEIKDRLDQYVVGQERAKKVLAVAVHNHYKRLSLAAQRTDVEMPKSNILLIGPTGCGKTLLASTLASILDIPFAISDATTLTEAGYVGEDVENVLLRLLHAADFDRLRAEKGIIYIDEIDKIARTYNNVSITRDVSGEGVQQALLKMLEGMVANIPPQGGRKHPEQQYIQMETKDILFICGGTFTGTEDIIARRVGKKTMGFRSDKAERRELTQAELLSLVEPDDLIEYGMIPEFVGRLPLIVPVLPLAEDELMQVLLEPKNAVVKQYQKLFEMEGAALEFTEAGLREIIGRARKRETGARALRATVENLMLDLMFELPSMQRGLKFVVTPEFARGEGEVVVVEERHRETA